VCATTAPGAPARRPPPVSDLPITTDHYERAAQLFNRCRAKGIAGSAIDLIICAVSAGYGAPVYTTDVDFRRYAGVLKLKLHAPPRDRRLAMRSEDAIRR